MLLSSLIQFLAERKKLTADEVKRLEKRGETQFKTNHFVNFIFSFFIPRPIYLSPFHWDNRNLGFSYLRPLFFATSAVSGEARSAPRSLRGKKFSPQFTALTAYRPLLAGIRLACANIAHPFLSFRRSLIIKCLLTLISASLTLYVERAELSLR